MNLEDAHGKSHRILQPKVIPLLLLINEWSRDGQKSLIKTEAIVLLLETLHLMLSKARKEITLQELCEKVDHVMRKESGPFCQSLQMTASDGYQFMKLFKDLSRLIDPPKEGESATPLIDYKNGVLGVFLKRCLQDYQRLTFAQVMLLHRQWQSFFNGPHNLTLNITKETDKEKLSKAKKGRNLTLGLQALILSHSKSDKVSVELKALHLAMLMAHFNHTEESNLALEEAIRLAQTNENELVLEHSLALLQQLCPSNAPRQSQVLIEQFIKNAKRQKQQLLVSTGRLQSAHLNLQLDVEPKNVILAVLSSQFDVFNSMEPPTHKMAIRSSALLLQANVLHQYGLTLLYRIPLQLLCHMTSCDESHTSHRMSDVAKAVQLLTRSLHQQGQTEVAIKLLKTSLNHLMSHDTTGSVTEPLKSALSELLIERRLALRDWSLAQESIIELKTFNSLLASYWRIKLLARQGQYGVAMRECQELLEKLRSEQPTIEVLSLQAQVKILKADILYSEGRPSFAVDTLLDALTFCKRYRFLSLSITAHLQLAQCQLAMSSIDSCFQTLDSLIPQIMTSDVSYWKAKYYQLLAEVSLLSSRQSQGHLSSSDLHKALGCLDQALYELRPHETLPTTLTKHIQILRALIFSQLENTNKVKDIVLLLKI